MPERERFPHMKQRGEEVQYKALTLLHMHLFSSQQTDSDADSEGPSLEMGTYFRLRSSA